MSLAVQQPLPGIELPRREPSAGQLLQIALEKESGIEIIERITALMERERDYQSRVSFDEALNSCQSQIGRIAPNAKRENGIMWADYAQLDRAVRPIYVGAGFSIAFSEEETADPMQLRMRATLSKAGISKDYFAQISRTAPNGKMSAQDAAAAAASRVKRYLLLQIFNIAVGIDTDEKKPFEEQDGAIDEKVLANLLDSLDEAQTREQLSERYFSAIKMATNANDRAATSAINIRRNKVWKDKGFRA